MSEATTEAAAETAATEGEQQQEQQDKTFTQAEVDQLIKDRAERIAKQKYPDYEDLKTRAEGAKTLEDRLADVESRYKGAETKALRSDIAAKFGVSAEDRDLFLTGTDEDTLTAQAKRLSERTAEVKKQGNVAPKEGASSSNGGSDQETRRYAKNLFGGSD